MQRKFYSLRVKKGLPAFSIVASKNVYAAISDCRSVFIKQNAFAMHAIEMYVDDPGKLEEQFSMDA